MNSQFLQLKAIKPRHDWTIETRGRLVMRAQNTLQHPTLARPGRIQSWLFVARPFASVVAIVVVLLGGVAAVGRAQNAAPGSTLFQLRLTRERAQLVFVRNVDSRARLAERYADQYYVILKERRGENGFVDSLNPLVRKQVQVRVVNDLDRIATEVAVLSDATKGEVSKLLQEARGKLEVGDVGSAVEAALLSQELLVKLAAAPEPLDKVAPSVTERPFKPVAASRPAAPKTGFVTDILFEPMDETLE